MQNNAANNYTADFTPPATGGTNATNAFYADSFSDVLMRSIGYYVTCEFLIGTMGLEQKSGFLYAAGVNFLTLHDVENNQYIVCDLYSIKFVTIHASRSETVPGANTNIQRGSSSRSFQPPQQARRNPAAR